MYFLQNAFIAGECLCPPKIQNHMLKPYTPIDDIRGVGPLGVN